MYPFIIKSYALALKLVASLRHRKAREFLELRSGKPDLPAGRRIWIHAASAGEGNQAIPIAEQLKKVSDIKVILSVFSPSGYHFHKHNPAFDAVVNLPLDHSGNAAKFIKELDPALAIFIRNEIWQGYLIELNRLKTPVFLVNAPAHVLKPTRFGFKNYTLRNLARFTKIYPAYDERKGGQGVSSEIVLSDFAGDTKWEASMLTVPPDSKMAEFTEDSLCIVGGSTWLKEEEFLQRWLEESGRDGVKLIIAPHMISQARIISLKSTLVDYCMYSRYTYEDQHNKVLVLNNYGHLQKAYQYADIAVIGGGFGSGIHNITEAAVYGIPVLFGPRHGKFAEAEELIANGTAFSFRNYSEFSTLLSELVTSAEKRQKIKQDASGFVELHTGISERIVEEIIGFIPPNTSDQ